MPKTAKIPLSDSQENYLETILILSRMHPEVRSVDIAERLQVKRASVAGALRSLKQKGLVDHQHYGPVTLTQKGESVANNVLNRHEALRDFMVNVLSIAPQEADAAACHMEHGISKHIVERFVDFARYYANCPNAGAQWANGFGYYCKEHENKRATCESCSNLACDGVSERISDC
jgi:DtxR family Mn-dependent transcriptional regulator